MRVLGFALCGLLAAAFPHTAHAERVDVPLRTGRPATGTVDRPGDVSTAAFLALDGVKRKLSISLKAAKGSSLQPDVTLFSPDGEEVDIAALGGKVAAKSKSWKAKLKSVPTAGLWRIEVRGADGTAGAYQITAASKDAESTKGSTVVLLGGSARVPIRAGDGYSVSVAVKRSRGSSIVPDIEIIDVNGNIVAASVGAAKQSSKKGTAKLKKFALPTFGDHLVRFVGDDATGGGISYSIKTSPTKFKGTRAVADPGAAFAAEPGIDATLDATGSRPAAPGGNVSAVWTQVGGPGAPLSDPASLRPTFRAPDAPASLAYQLAVTEGGLVSEPRLVVVEVAPRPIADPGRTRRVAPGTSVTLNAAESYDRSSRGLTYLWRVIEGDVVLDDPASPTPSFTAPSGEGVVRLGLVVDDGRARSFEATQLIAVSGAPRAAADAGREQYVGRMASVHLSGLASQRASGPLDSGAAWTQLSGPPVELAGADTFTPSFTAPRHPADLLFELRVDDETETAGTTWVRVRPDESNAPPVALVNGPLVATSGSATVEATNSVDVDGDDIAVRWAVLSGDGASLSSRSSSHTDVGGLQDPAGRWIVIAQPRDDRQYGAPDVVRVIGPSYAGAPLAAAGPDRTVNATMAVGLDGSHSVSAGGNGPLAYTWRQVSGTDWYDVAAEDPTFDVTAQRPQFRLPSDLSSLTSRRSLTFELIVRDTNGSGAPDLVTLTFTGLPLNSAPVAVASASETNPLPATEVTLLATLSDRDGDEVTPSWAQVSGPSVNFAPSLPGLPPVFITPAAGTLVFELTGSDGFALSAPSRITIIVDEKPVAIATADPPDGPAATLVRFDASTSFDPEGRDLTYSWTQIAGTGVSFDAAASTFQAQSPVGGMAFRLVVNDGRQSSDPVQIGFSDATPPTVAPSADDADVPYGTTVQLSANPSDAEPATFTWRQVNPSGNDPVVTLSSTSAERPTFTVPLPTSTAFGSAPRATFGVKASRDGRDSEEKTVVVTFYASFNDSSVATNDRVYGIISQNCTSCHRGTNSSCPVGSGGNATGLGMATANAFRNNAIGVGSCNSSKNRVQASSSAQSFLMDRLNGVGGAMPPSGLLPAVRRNIVQDWIDQGADPAR